jgi:hypothetical protein
MGDPCRAVPEDVPAPAVVGQIGICRVFHEKVQADLHAPEAAQRPCLQAKLQERPEIP